MKEDGGSATADAGGNLAEGGGSCTVPSANGIQCFGEPRCNALSDSCCVALQGGNTLVGTCIPRGDGGVLAKCMALNAVQWECDRAKDCQSGGSRCCIPGLFALGDRTMCPVPMLIDTNVGPPADGKATRCTQEPSCPATMLPACEKDTECATGEKCTPVTLNDKVFGICLKPN